MVVEFDRDTDEFYADCVSRGRLPRNDALKQVVLERTIEQFEMGKTYPKLEVNDVLKQQFDDYVLVRRELVNFGYVRYDNRDNSYEVQKLRLSEEDYRENTRLERHARDLGVLE